MFFGLRAMTPEDVLQASLYQPQHGQTVQQDSSDPNDWSSMECQPLDTQVSSDPTADSSLGNSPPVPGASSNQFEGSAMGDPSASNVAMTAGKTPDADMASDTSSELSTAPASLFDPFENDEEGSVDSQSSDVVPQDVVSSEVVSPRCGIPRNH